MLGLKKDNLLIWIIICFGGLLQAQSVIPPTPLIPKIKEYRLYKPQTSKLNIDAFIKRGYFCKLEDKVHETSKFPVLFRLGTKRYVDKLEHK